MFEKINRNKIISIKLTEKELEIFKIMCKNNNTSMSEYVRILIFKEIEKKSKGKNNEK